MDKRYAAAALLLLGVVTGCGTGDGSESRPTLPTPTRSLSADVTRTPESTDSPTTSDLPDASPTTPTTPTESVTEPSSSPATPTPTRTRTPRPTATATATATTTATATATVTNSATVTVEPTPTPTPTATPTAEPQANPDEGSESGIPSWAWWLLAAIVLAGAAAVPLIIRRRHDARWRGDLAGAEDDLAWFARSLVPALRHDLTEWTPTASARVASAEDRLTVLAERGRHDSQRARALTLRDAARYGREQVDAVAAGSGPARERLDGVQERLERALGGQPPG